MLSLTLVSEQTDLIKHHWRAIITSISVTSLSTSNSAVCTSANLIQVLGQYFSQHVAGMKERASLIAT